jgi:hypothetical protein
MNYGFNKKCINTLDEIDMENKNDYYRYKETDFYYKKVDDSNNLVVSFHGARRDNVPIPIFRFYNHNYNILCFSDKLLEIHYGKINIGWFLSPKGKNFHQIYFNIIQFFIKKYKNIVFFGSSAGGLMALTCASRFKKEALLQNPQLYLKNYYKLHITPLVNATNINVNEVNAEEVIRRYGLPRKAYISCNIRDEHHYTMHFTPFKNFIIDNGYQSNFKFVEFEGADPIPPQKHHTIQNPPHINNDDELIDEIFSN